MLFRKQIWTNQITKSYGEIEVARPLSPSIFAVLALFCVTIAVLIAGNLSYTSRVSAKGHLVSEVNPHFIRVQRAGLVTNINVKEGDRVTVGVPLVSISNYQSEFIDRISNNFNERRSAIKSEITLLRENERKEILSLEQRQRSLVHDKRLLEEEIALAKKRIMLAEKSKSLYSELSKNGFVSSVFVDSKRDITLELQANLVSLERSRSALNRQVIDTQYDISKITNAATLSITKAKGALIALEKELEEYLSNNLSTLKSSVEGQVTAISVRVGQVVVQNEVIGAVVPPNKTIIAEIFVDSNSVGLIKPSNKVILKQEGLYFRKFGHLIGSVQDISQVPVQASEIPAIFVNQAKGVPLHKVTLQLDRQSVLEQGMPRPLSAGSLMHAEILLEKRNVFASIFEPILNAKKRFIESP
jgi:membrane fusion protein